MAEHRTASRIAKLIAPVPSWIAQSGRIVEAAKQPGNGRHRFIGLHPRWIRGLDDVAGNEFEPFPAVTGRPERQWCRVESNGSQLTQESSQVGFVRLCRPEHLVTAPHHTASIRHPAGEHDVVHRSETTDRQRRGQRTPLPTASPRAI
jgi:hypothetical protein